MPFGPSTTIRLRLFWEVGAGDSARHPNIAMARSASRLKRILRGRKVSPTILESDCFTTSVFPNRVVFKLLGAGGTQISNGSKLPTRVPCQSKSLSPVVAGELFLLTTNASHGQELEPLHNDFSTKASQFLSCMKLHTIFWASVEVSIRGTGCEKGRSPLDKILSIVVPLTSILGSGA